MKFTSFYCFLALTATVFPITMATAADDAIKCETSTVPTIVRAADLQNMMNEFRQLTTVMADQLTSDIKAERSTRKGWVVQLKLLRTAFMRFHGLAFDRNNRLAASNHKFRTDIDEHLRVLVNEITTVPSNDFTSNDILTDAIASIKKIRIVLGNWQRHASLHPVAMTTRVAASEFYVDAAVSADAIQKALAALNKTNFADVKLAVIRSAVLTIAAHVFLHPDLWLQAQQNVLRNGLDAAVHTSPQAGLVGPYLTFVRTFPSVSMLWQ